MGKTKNEDDGREVCSLCFCVMGVSQRDKRKLPDGRFAEESCIKKTIHKDLIQPIKKFAPNLNHPPLSSAPEIILKSLTFSLLAQPISAPWVQDFLSKILNFSQSFLGK